MPISKMKSVSIEVATFGANYDLCQVSLYMKFCPKLTLPYFDLFPTKHLLGLTDDVGILSAKLTLQKNWNSKILGAIVGFI